LVNKGLGTDIVNIVNGDIEAITLDIVLQAAESGDELADDLVRRAGLALGVRAAYLVNIFGATTVMIGGGAEKKEGGFIKYVKESQERFLLEELRGEVEVISCTLGKEAPSVGAAALCRRELFMEV
jgi:glucokinase